MNKNFLLITFLLFTQLTYADQKKYDSKKYKPNPDCIFDVIPLNSPVKESEARFLVKTPEKFEIDEVSYQIKNSGKIFEKPRGYQKIDLVSGPEGKEIRVNVSKLPPGFYQLLVKIKDKGKKEHNFKTKFKDHAMFVIDQSLEVPMPDPKKNNATIAGIDSDNDGIRDDVQRWINEEFSSQPKVKAAMEQVASGRQLDLINVNDKEKSIEIGKKILNDSSCLKHIVGIQKRNKLLNELELKLLNTKDRLYADVKANSNFSGQLWEAPSGQDAEKALCGFDPDNI